MAGIQEIADLTGLSKATVSRALRGLPVVAPSTVVAVRDAAESLGYIPSASASGLATGRNRAIGVIVPTFDRWFYSQVLDGVDRELRQRGYDLIVYNLGDGAGDRDRVFHRSILRHRVDALILLALTFSLEEREQLRQTEYPTIAVGGPGPGMRHIGIDDYQASFLAVGHLVDLGHQRIALIGGVDDKGLNDSVPRNRLSGFEAVLAMAGLTARPEWVVDGHYRFTSAYEATRKLFADRSDRPTALFCASDEMAFGAIAALTGLGLRVPRDVSIVGIDGHEVGESLGLTTIAQFPVEQGRRAARQVLDELDGAPFEAAFDSAPFEFVLRTSTAPPAHP